ncbi:hypothetical protein AB6A23_16635 [Paenibacillus tarimensis]
MIADIEGLTTVDIVEKLAIPLPVTVIADLLGVPSKDWVMIKSWSDIIFLLYAKDTYDDIAARKAQVMKEFYAYLYPIVLEKRKHPVYDIISDLPKSRAGGRKIDG